MCSICFQLSPHCAGVTIGSYPGAGERAGATAAGGAAAAPRPAAVEPAPVVAVEPCRTAWRLIEDLIYYVMYRPFVYEDHDIMYDS